MVTVLTARACRARLLLVIGMMFVGGAVSAAEPADLIYCGGDIVTVDDNHPSAEAVAVRQGRIVAVGKKADILAHKGEGTKLVDLGGKTMVPGFLDPHSHFTAALLIVNWANVSAPPVGPVTDIPGIIRELKQFAERTRPAKGEWIVAYGYDGTALKEGRDLTRDDLDGAFPDRPQKSGVGVGGGRSGARGQMEGGGQGAGGVSQRHQGPAVHDPARRADLAGPRQAEAHLVGSDVDGLDAEQADEGHSLCERAFAKGG